MRNSAITTPIRIHVTKTRAHADAPNVEGADHLTAALAHHLQRIACEGARAAWCQAPDTAHLIHVVEELGLMEFGDG